MVLLRIERSDYRRSKEAGLLAGLRSRDPLALAEAYHRTSPAAHSCARRLLGNARDTEALLRTVYTQLWESPPETARIEGWVRSRCFRIASDHLRAHMAAPASPSLAMLLPDLPAPEGMPNDPAEQALAALPEEDRRALLLAHDQGMPTAAQDDPAAAAALDRALMALAGPGEGVDDGAVEECDDLPGMADWTLGLLEAEHAARVMADIIDRPACASRSRALRRGRRRLEGLPPAPDLGQRVLASVLGAAAGPAGTAPTPAATPTPAAGPTPGPTPAAGPIPAAAPTPAPVPPTSPPPRPAADTPPPDAPPGAGEPHSSLGDAPEGLMPVAPLPSALDSEPPPPPPAHLPPGLDQEEDDPDRADAAIDEAPEPPQAIPEREEDTDDGGDLRTKDAAQELTTGTKPEQADLVSGDQAEAQPPSQPDADTSVVDEDGGDTAAADRRADARDQPAPAVDAALAPAPAGRKVVRQLLNALAILVVLAAGAGLGLLIGFLLVGGR